MSAGENYIKTECGPLTGAKKRELIDKVVFDKLIEPKVITNFHVLDKIIEDEEIWKGSAEEMEKKIEEKAMNLLAQLNKYKEAA